MYDAIMNSLPQDSATRNPENLPEIHRVIVAAIIFSSDGKILMGKKNPHKGGVYPDAWHIPGGGVEESETLEGALTREMMEEVGLDVTNLAIKQLPDTGHGETVKTLENGTRVWCNMEFNHFEVRLDKPADVLAKELVPGDDLVELRWFSKDEISNIRQIPGGKEFFKKSGYL
jgi:8-oxo-dGTP pyrophosphatase MutT (NUDIX family)